MNKFETDAERAVKSLVDISNEYVQNKEECCFSVDGRNGQLSQRKIAEAINFLQKYGFVCIVPDESSEFSNNITSLISALNSPQPSGHAAFDFLQKKASKEDDAKQQLVQTLTDEIHDFEPSAVSHSQAAWDIRCSGLLRQFFAYLHQKDSGKETQDMEIAQYADLLVPSIENLVDAKKHSQTTIEDKKKKCLQSLPTFYYNPMWARAPHVIAAYHLDSHNELVQSHFKEYEQQMSTLGQQIAKSKDDQQIKEFEHSVARTQQRWLQRVKREVVTTAKKVILGKRATNKMVQDAAFNSKKSAADNDNENSDAESMRPLQTIHDATIVVGNGLAKENNSISLNLIPGFHQYYLHYLCCKRAKWSQLSGDSVSVAADEDDHSEKLFKQTSVTIDLPVGTILIMNRNVPRWIESKIEQPFWLLPVSYRVHNRMASSIVEQLSSKPLIGAEHCCLHAAKICPFELALSSTYMKSIADGIIYTSLPHLTGATYFSRSTKKTAMDLKQKRIQLYQKWSTEQRHKKEKVEYRAPRLPSYLENLLTTESNLLNVIENQLETAEKTLAEQQIQMEKAELRSTNKRRKIVKEDTTVFKEEVGKEVCKEDTSFEEVVQRNPPENDFWTQTNGCRIFQDDQELLHKSLSEFDTFDQITFF